ncbi:MAG: Crp/Fnr family transcriptional regulator [Moheibacter sp.]
MASSKKSVIDQNILITYGGVAKRYEKGELIYQEGNIANFFYQVIEGKVRIFCANDEGKELTRYYVLAGQTFGEAPILTNKPYACTAQASASAVVIKIGIEKLLNLLHDFPEIANDLLFNFAQKLYASSCSTQILNGQTPEEKITRFLTHNKKGGENVIERVPFTRQQIADFTGLRVETVIRALLRMNEQGKVKIINRKVYF